MRFNYLKQYPIVDATEKYLYYFIWGITQEDKRCLFVFRKKIQKSVDDTIEKAWVEISEDLKKGIVQNIKLKAVFPPVAIPKNYKDVIKFYYNNEDKAKKYAANLIDYPIQSVKYSI